MWVIKVRVILDYGLPGPLPSKLQIFFSQNIEHECMESPRNTVSYFDQNVGDFEKVVQENSA